jgi:hypothetical protein
MTAFYRARFLLWQGDLRGAAERVDHSVQDAGPGLYGSFFAELSRHGLVEATWRTWFERLTIEGAALRGRLFSAQILAEVALAYGRLPLAKDALAWAVDHGFKDVYWWDRCPVVRRLDDDRDVAALRARVAELAARVHAAYVRGGAG